MFLKDVLQKCRDEGYPVTAMGLYTAGRKYGFLNKKDNSRNLDFDKEKFFEWLNKAKEEIPEGWLPLSELKDKLNISLSQLYILCKDENSGTRSFGAGKGVIYADPERIKQVIEHRKQNHKEQW